VTCTQNSTTISSLVGGNVNFFGTTGQTNSGTLKTKGIDLSMSYRFDNVFGGTLTPSIDMSRVLVWRLGDFVIAGVKVADGYDGLGFINNSTGRINNAVPEWRGTFGVTYRFDVHTVNVRASYIPGLINDSDTDFATNATRNANIGNSLGFTTNGSVCTITPAQPFTSNLGAVPVGAGSGSYGTGVVATAAGNVRGYCAAQNAPVLSGSTIDRNLNVDLVYRVQLPSDVGLTLTVNNLLDERPPFFRGIVAYNTAFGSPLERNYKLGISKRF
jgi:outer membrane receptor protein involved in Fe transport